MTRIPIRTFGLGYLPLQTDIACDFCADDSMIALRTSKKRDTLSIEGKLDPRNAVLGTNGPDRTGTTDCYLHLWA
jgi:hypothetical protein